MRHLTVTICLTIAVLLGSAGVSFALPACPGTWNSTTWSNCFGTYTFDNGSKYVGGWKKGEEHGQGTFTYASGSKYVGGWKKGEEHGQGTMTYSDGRKYVGEWKDDKRHGGSKWNGQGTMTYPDGRKYVGEWKYNVKHGQGTYTDANGLILVGMWKDNRFQGTVKISSISFDVALESSGLPACSGPSSSWSNCLGKDTENRDDVYVGEWRDGKRHGQGTWYFFDGRAKGGIWENGDFKYFKKLSVTPTVTAAKPSVTSSPKLSSSGLPACSGSVWSNCVGTKTWSSGMKYVGEWRDGERNGQGTSTYADGNKYVGEWRDDDRHGQGTMIYTDGKKYVGEYRDNKRNGQGTETYVNGTVKKGIWENGQFQYAKKPPVTPTVIVKKPSVTPAPAPAPKLVFSKQVFSSQEALQVLGLYSGKLDGLAGSGTANAIKEWQQRTGLPKTGEVTGIQLAKLEDEALAHYHKTKSKPVSVASIKDNKSDKYAGIDFGKYHALVIGIDEYKHLPKLKTAVNDAEAVARILQNDYGFDVTLLRNAKRSDVMDALDDYESNLGINDNLLIYYAGHGDLDKKSKQGYWWPADAKKGKRSNWISNGHISASLRALEARHVIVVADSCYSGTLVRSVTTSVDSRSKDVRSLNLKRSRGALTSGGLEEVVDSVGGNNSPFAKAFIDALNDNKGVVDMSSMYPAIRRSVLMSTEQSPVYSDIRNTEDEGGDFFFVRKK